MKYFQYKNRTLVHLNRLNIFYGFWKKGSTIFWLKMKFYKKNDHKIYEQNLNISNKLKLYIKKQCFKFSVSETEISIKIFIMSFICQICENVIFWEFKFELDLSFMVMKNLWEFWDVLSSLSKVIGGAYRRRTMNGRLMMHRKVPQNCVFFTFHEL